uniref:Uncharacterized protein n=1 Tax=Pararge aegeria TaxID=116150 RepID=S4P478_9NEOP
MRRPLILERRQLRFRYIEPAQENKKKTRENNAEKIQQFFQFLHLQILSPQNSFFFIILAGFKLFTKMSSIIFRLCNPSWLRPKIRCYRMWP